MRLLYLYLLASISTLVAEDTISRNLIFEARLFATNTPKYPVHKHSSSSRFRSQLPPLSTYDQFVQHTNQWNSSQFAKYFDPLMLVGFVHETQILTLYKLYKHPGFRAYLTTLPSFAQHIASLHAKMHCCKMHTKKLGSITGLWRSQLKKYLCPMAQQAQQIEEKERALQSREAQRMQQKQADQ